MLKTLCAGLGQLYLRDEGIGCRLIQALEARAEEFLGVEFQDLGTGGAALLHLLPGRPRAHIVDCAFMGLPPGTMRRFRPEDVEDRAVTFRHSLHQGNLLEFLHLLDRLGEGPGELVLWGIEPALVEPGEGLSPVLERGWPGYLEIIGQELRRPMAW